MKTKQIEWKVEEQKHRFPIYYGCINGYQICVIYHDTNLCCEPTGKFLRMMDSARPSFFEMTKGKIDRKIEMDSVGKHKSLELAKKAAQRVFEDFIQECINE